MALPTTAETREYYNFRDNGDGTTARHVYISGTGVSLGASVDYTKRVDFVGETLIYKGFAAVGSSESASVWKIIRVTLSGDDVTEEYADGNSNFDNAWDNRLSLSYS